MPCCKIDVVAAVRSARGDVDYVAESFRVGDLGEGDIVLVDAFVCKVFPLAPIMYEALSIVLLSPKERE